ncbi:endolytic transglycosylase MltG [Pacificimonas sp. ICDLI1SI03]
MRRFLLILLFAIVAGGAIWSFTVVSSWTDEGPLAEGRNVVIPRGSSQTAAAQLLEEQGVLADAQRFTLLARFLGSDMPIRAGEFRFPAGVSPSQALNIMQTAEPVQRRITVPEGLPSILVHERLMAADFLTGSVPVPEEGSVLPDTYQYERNETRAAVLQRMQQAMTDELAAAWQNRSSDTVVTTPEEAIILASIVEKETGTPEERTMVAGVYSNRLRQGMRLQADPTIIYLQTRGKPLGRRILRSEIERVDGYNTYSMDGLPAGPITNPGRASLQAVLNPADTDALYFVADGTGGHVFAKTLAEHNENVRKWRAFRREQGI